METEYEKLMKLLRVTADGLYELNDLLKKEPSEKITKEQYEALQEELIRFTSSVRGFGI